MITDYVYVRYPCDLACAIGWVIMFEIVFYQLTVHPKHGSPSAMQPAGDSHCWDIIKIMMS